jgi:hypothetical protein
MKDVSPAVAYAMLLPELMQAGRDVGYAIAVHGSLSRDLDVVAVPWTDEAVSAERLVMHLMSAVGGRLRDGHKRKDGTEDQWEKVSGGNPAVKPHGRLAWSIFIADGSR